MDDVEAAAEELRLYDPSFKADFKTQQHGDITYRLFFVVAPDGLCYCIGEAQK